MLNTLFSGDLPRSRLLAAILVAIVLSLLALPFLVCGVRPLNTAATICIFILLVASYDLILGYTGIVSFAHGMFYAIGAYGIAIALNALGGGWTAVFIGLGAGLAVSVLVALAVGAFALRVQAIYYTMITLAVASAFSVMVIKLSGITGGEDGTGFEIPEALSPGFRLVEEEVLGAVVNGRMITYYLILFSVIVLFLVMLRVVNSPFGRVMQALRENQFRAEAIGFRVTFYRTLANCIAAAVATCAGALMALWLHHVGPQTTVSFSIMMNILLMSVIGGMGTLYGAVVGAALFVVAENYLQLGMKQISQAMTGVPVLENLFHPDRWMLWLGVLFVLSVYFFPTGVVGKLRERRAALGAGR
ncbi:branched-chain amino acid ABC transporter permease [Noviherbaspirillum galbum]|uniref:Branched-chain amino acid ABC transporter permease n=1 Tax=Noviherbaspirillum galbum TaxID=2709383 RepID=A0A6B3SX90_9BURK|nr:branched-chain amino acid ABC transporter permease [Noviherbaspirillum galbum]NEX63716.1 branched-chain amino acid ABC transporter permease [Noviherbaspirillum galbum]